MKNLTLRKHDQNARAVFVSIVEGVELTINILQKTITFSCEVVVRRLSMLILGEGLMTNMERIDSEQSQSV